MLKRLFMVFTAFMLTSLSYAQERDITTIRLGLKVAVDLPTELLTNAAINRLFNPDSLFIKRHDGSYISITPINKELLVLSESFNLSDYPKYILALSDVELPSELNSADLESLMQARTIWRSKKNGQTKVSVHEQDTGTLYARCEKALCHNFFVEHAQNDEIIVIEVSGIANDIFLETMGGGQKK